MPVDGMTDEELRAGDAADGDHVPRQRADDGRAGGDDHPRRRARRQWRILVGDDAQALDRMVRETPEHAYEQQFAKALNDSGHMRLLE